MKGAGPAQAVLVVGQAGHQDVPDPEGHAQFSHMPGHGEDVLVRSAGEPAVLFGVDLLQVQDHQAGVLHQLVEGGQVGRVVGAEGFAAAVSRAVWTFFWWARRKNSVRKGSWSRGSPPLTVMPPFLPQ